jgi:hypothetical protein
MAINDTPIQSTYDRNSGRTVTLDGSPESGGEDTWTTPTSGNLLILWGSARHSATGTADIQLPTGFNLVGKFESSISYRASWFMAWKVSDGTESSLAVDFHPTTDFFNVTTLLGLEFPATDLELSAAADTAENETYVGTNTQSIGPGTLTNTVADALMIAGMGNYSMDAWENPPGTYQISVDNSFTIRGKMDWSSYSYSVPQGVIATRVVSSVAGISPVFSTTDTGSVAYAAGVVFDGSAVANYGSERGARRGVLRGVMRGI